MVTVGRDGSLPHAPLTIGLPPDSWTEGVPEKARIVFSASFTPSAIAACEFFRQATVYLSGLFQLDGFRFDSTETIVNGGHYTDSTPYVIAKGPDGNYEFGAGKGWEFLGMLRTALRRAADAAGKGWPYLAGENSPENPPQ